jgi:hypothetical protein
MSGVEKSMKKKLIFVYAEPCDIDGFNEDAWQTEATKIIEEYMKESVRISFHVGSGRISIVPKYSEAMHDEEMILGLLNNMDLADEKFWS